MTQADVDMIALFRMAARDELGGSGNIAEGYVANFYSDTATVDVKFPQYQNATSTAPLVMKNVPLGSPYVGSGYGLEVYPEVGTPCLVELVEKETGASVSACLKWNTAVAPKGGLQPGQFRITSKSGAVLLFDSNGNIVFQNGTTPVAVEGSQVSGSLSTAKGSIDLLDSTGHPCTGTITISGAEPIAIAAGQGAQDVLAPGPGGK